MIPWISLAKTKTPDGKGELELAQHDTEYSISINGYELMNSRVCNSEKVLAKFSCDKIKMRKEASVLIGGLGMGFTLSAALETLNKDAGIVVSELVPAIVEWNKEILGKLADFPLNDSRVTVEVKDVVQIIGEKTDAFDAIILDVDNGPAGLTQTDNNRLYSNNGLAKIKNALKSGGVLAIWSAGPDKVFSNRIKKYFRNIEEKRVRARENNKGSTHTLWFAQK